jgi:isopenicillin-N epimerase
LQFRDRFGEEAIRRYNRDLVLEGSALLARRWDTHCGGSPELTGSMRTVKLPDGFDADPSAVLALKNEVTERFKVQAPIRPFNGQVWTRVSAQIYNDLGDFERLADAVDTLRRRS